MIYIIDIIDVLNRIPQVEAEIRASRSFPDRYEQLDIRVHGKPIIFQGLMKKGEAYQKEFLFDYDLEALIISLRSNQLEEELIDTIRQEITHLFDKD